MRVVYMHADAGMTNVEVGKCLKSGKLDMINDMMMMMMMMS